ncbi:hypothetical protein PybrP1_005473 [[Pythium] brassicae (nom. inval.)]|nr:hypothetical protein PybrP1_005473 [[Pythium] brassicae (nom. inval.)]
MASGGFRQDSRYFNQSKKLLAKMAFPKCFDEKVDLRKVQLEVVHQWVHERVTQLLGFEDDIVASLVVNLLEPKVDERLDPRQLQVAITGFLEGDAPAFTQELWELLLSAQANAMGIPTQLLEKKKRELEQLASEKDKLRQVLERKRLEASAPTTTTTMAAAAAALDKKERGTGSGSCARSRGLAGLQSENESAPLQRRAQQRPLSYAFALSLSFASSSPLSQSPASPSPPLSVAVPIAIPLCVACRATTKTVAIAFAVSETPQLALNAGREGIVTPHEEPSSFSLSVALPLSVALLSLKFLGSSARRLVRAMMRLLAWRVAAGHAAASEASESSAELDAFLAKEEAAAREAKAKMKSSKEEEEPKLFMELGWAAQLKIGTKAPVLRQVEGDSLKQRLRAYRRSVFFHIHGERLAALDALDHNGYLLHQLRMNKQDPNGKDGALTAVRTLVYEEATIDDPDLEMRWTPLHYAVMGGHESVVERLIEKAPVRRITINRKDACGEDHAGVARLLLRKKAFIDETDEDGWSALHYAAVNDSALAAEVLVQYDANLKARTLATNETALEMAERLRSHLVAILLYEVTYRKA